MPRSATPACPDARRAVRWYKTRVRYWAHKMGAGRGTPRASRRDGASPSRDSGAEQDAQGRPVALTKQTCPQIHRAVRFWRAKAAANRRRYQEWAYQYDWRSWMPDKWQRIGACETGYGKRPGDFHWNSGTYQGFVGFYYGTWDAYKPRGFPAEAYQATPRQQWIVAERVRATVGYGAWGCGGS